MDEGLEVDGLVERTKTFSFEDLSNLPDQIATVSEIAPGRQGGAVPLSALVRASKPHGTGHYVTLRADDFSVSVPLEAVVEHALLVYRLGESPLPASEGGPIRFLIPDVAACGTDQVDECASVKYLQRITFTSEKGADTRPMNRLQHVELHLQEGK